MRIQTMVRGVAVELASIEDPELREYVRAKGKSPKQFGGLWRVLSDAQWRRRPGVTARTPDWAHQRGDDDISDRRLVDNEEATHRAHYPRTNTRRGRDEYEAGARDDV